MYICLTKRMEINKTYNSKKSEEKWYDHWMKKKYFFSKPDSRKPYTIVIPPPNVTGVLHMGHMLNNTLQDVMVRRARMMGYNACWVPGTDHASIATEAKVVKKLAKNGIKKTDLTREEFLKHAFEWKNEHGGIILEQLKKLGASCDWERTKFTMDDNMSDSVIKVFIDLYNKGYIYRGIRMVNWDPSAKTAISDEEVIHKEVNSKLYYISYEIKDSDEKLTVATTRPETILADAAICVNPSDSRYQHLKNKMAIIPLINKSIPIIFDDYVDMEFGTGALKITPAHDINDYKIGDKYDLEIIDILNDNGTLNESAKLYTGKDRFEVRKEIAIDLAKANFLVKTEEHTNKVGFSERTDAVIEPKLSMQWFCKMDQLSKPALDAVNDKKVKLHPNKYINTYKHWMENIKDWCVSRQLWWGQQIPAYYYDGNKFVVAETKQKALVLAQKENPNVKISDLRQDEDVLDTWFSSWLWPLSVFDGIKNPENEEINYYYPTNDLVTGAEIIFFWVARMIMAGYEYKNEIPFKNVFFNGIVRDNIGRKMSKSLGNSPDPIELIDKYGADGVRVGMLLCSPAGNDLPFDEGLCEQGRNFSNKIWNALRLVKSWNTTDSEQSRSSNEGIEWFENKLNQTINEVDTSMSKYRISEALMTIYKIIWDDFCSWYLEIIKPKYGEPIDITTYRMTITFFEQLLKLLHPFMPFLTEEIWHLLKKQDTDIIVSTWPKYSKHDVRILEKFNVTKEVVASIRTIRKDNGLNNKDSLELFIINNENVESFNNIISKLVNISNIKTTKEKLENSFTFLIKSNEYFVPLSSNINTKEQIRKLQKELNYTIGFLDSVERKLNNEKFVNNAPAQVVKNEIKKMSDAKGKINILKKRIESLKS